MNQDNTVEELRRKYIIDESFYPSMSMDVDLPNGLKGEVVSIRKSLEENGFSDETENIIQVMRLKKELLREYGSKAVLKDETAEYKNILGVKKPIGSTAPIEYILTSGLTAIVLYAA